MSANKQKNDIVSLSNIELEARLEQVASRAAHKALKEIGLDDDEAATDIRTLRDLAASIRAMQRTFLQTFVRWLTIGLFALLVAGIAAKIGIFSKFFTTK